jgi:hypothetical protein
VREFIRLQSCIFVPLRRFISSILAFLVLVSVFFPCSDSNVVPAGKAETFITAANDCGSHHAEDACSPFCTCTCCAGFILSTPEVLALRPVLLFPKRVFADYLPDAINKIALPVWQPPQLA